VKKFLVVMLIAAGSSSALANKYGTAGCGLGAMVFADQKGMIQILAATINGTSLNQSFGLTSGTLGCEENRSTATLQYIESNQVSLKNDISRGQGETLTGLLNLWGCQDYNQVGAVLQQNFGSFSNSAEAVQLKSQLQSVIQNNTSTAQVCQQLI
jgi:hypothetical protein